tara:strand:- start:2884 stop:3120 length:237 start_codon:yes stop_codon:yes gene_type:complete
MRDKKKIELNLINYFKKKGFKVDKNSNLIEKEILDSIGIFELISYLEKKFALKISHNSMNAQNFKSVYTIISKVFKLK